MIFRQVDFSVLQSFYPGITCLLYNFYLKIRGKNLICVKTGGTKRKFSFINRPSYELLVLPAQYHSILEKQKILLDECRVSVSYNSLVAVNEKKLVVYKCSFNKIGCQNVKNNYHFLKTSGFEKCPNAVSISEVDDVIISAEDLSEGIFLKLEDLNTDVISKLLHDLKQMYLDNISHQSFDVEKEFGQYDYLFAYYPPDWREAVSQIRTKIKRLLRNNLPETQICKTLIHGDLTYRNILKSNKSTIYVDFDRSETSYPEFDFYLFCVDLETHKTGTPTYESLFANIFELIDGKPSLTEEFGYYKILPDFAANRAFTQEIKWLFLYRTLVLTLQYYMNTTRIPAMIFTQVNSGLSKYEVD